MTALGVHHAEHPGLTGVCGERSRDREPVDANHAQPARGQLPARHAPDRADPDDHDVCLDHSHSGSIDPSSAGRAHTARGDALRAALDRLTAELSQWSRAAVEIAVALRASANRYADADVYAAARIA